MIVAAAQLILEQATGERCFVDLPSGKQAGHAENLRVIILCGIVLCRENSIMQLGMGNLMDKRGNSLCLAHTLTDGYRLLSFAEYAVAVRVHVFKADRHGRGALQSLHKGLVLLHVAFNRGRQLRQRFALGLRHVKDCGHTETRDGDLLFLHDGLPVFIQHGRFGIGVEHNFLYGFLGDRRCDDLDAFFALLDIPLEFVPPLVEARHTGGVGLLHEDEHGIVEGITVKAAHGLQILLILAAGEHIPDTAFNAIRDLLQTFPITLFRRVLCFGGDGDLQLDGLTGQMPVELLFFIGIDVGVIRSAAGIETEHIAVFIRIRTKNKLLTVIQRSLGVRIAISIQGSSACEDAVILRVLLQLMDELIELVLEGLRFELWLMVVPGAEELRAGMPHVGPQVADAAAVFEQLRLRIAESALVRGSGADHDS